MSKLPKQYQSIRKKYLKYHNAVNNLGKAAREAGPIQEKDGHLIQLAAAAAVKSEGSVHSHARRAMEAGATLEEMEHAVILTSSIIGFSAVSAALSWISDVVE
jgi:4-carboxymuconolactone decarboxylase